MDSSSNNEPHPFWVDEPEYSGPPSFSRKLLLFGAWLFHGWIILSMVAIPSIIMWEYFSPIIAIVWLILITLGFLLAIYNRKKWSTFLDQIQEIQHQASLSLGADHIGSAVHIAGHPALDRDQPVVLALSHDQLLILSYQESSPIDIIPIDLIDSIYTVVYDEDRIPHRDVIDPTAQALQLTFHHHDQAWTCLFRRMRKIRPIDWYHLFQKARLDSSIGN